MKKLLSLLIALAFASSLHLHAQFSAGISDSRYVYGAYRFAKNFSVKLEHSLYSEKFGFQRIGAGVGYASALPYGFGWKADANAATTWNGNYQLVYGDLGANYTYRRLGLEAIIQPRYDSGLGYKTCWEVGASVLIVKPVSVLLGYTTIPQYRMSEKRVSGGFEFAVQKLRVRPELSVSMEKGTRFKNMRVLMSMNYDF